MQVEFLRKNAGKNLVVFALGWGCDANVITHLVSQFADNMDVVCTFNYKNIENIDEICAPYNKVYLLAWSFGVWAAEQMFSNKVTFTKAIALCASPQPVSTNFGIAPKRLKVTIKGFKIIGTDDFDALVYGDNTRVTSNRERSEIIEELEILEQEASKPYKPNIQWDSAIIGEKDKIFPAKNLLAYWGIKAKVLPLSHFPFEDFKLIQHYLGI